VTPPDTRDANIILIGYRGTGKTTVGRLLAGRLARPFVDADERVETGAGKSIAEIFATEGEVAFRDRESAALAAVCSGSAHVISTGGGAVLREANRRLLTASGFVVWLTSAPETIWERLQADPVTSARRPNLTVAGGIEEVRALLAVRTLLYAETADLTVASDIQSPQEVVEAILTVWNGGSTSRPSSGACGCSSPG
jgi:shikimate kinase